MIDISYFVVPSQSEITGSAPDFPAIDDILSAPYGPLTSCQEAAGRAREVALAALQGVHLIRRTSTLVGIVDQDARAQLVALPRGLTGDIAGASRWALTASGEELTLNGDEHADSQAWEAAIQLSTHSCRATQIRQEIYTEIAALDLTGEHWFRGELTQAEWRIAFPGTNPPDEPRLTTQRIVRRGGTPVHMAIPAEVALQRLDERYKDFRGFRVVNANTREYTPIVTHAYTNGDHQQKYETSGLFTVVMRVGPAGTVSDGSMLTVVTGTDLNQFALRGRVISTLEDFGNSMAESIARKLVD